MNIYIKKTSFTSNNIELKKHSRFYLDLTFPQPNLKFDPIVDPDPKLDNKNPQIFWIELI